MELQLGISPGNPELRASLEHLVGHPDVHQIQAAVSAVDRLAEDDPAGKGFDFVIAETGHGYALDDQRRLVPVPGDDLDLLTVGDNVCRPQIIGARDPQCRQLIDYLAALVLAGKGIGTHKPVLIMAPDAGETAVVRPEDPDLVRGLGGKVAVEQVGAVLVHPDIELAR